MQRADLPPLPDQAGVPKRTPTTRQNLGTVRPLPPDFGSPPKVPNLTPACLPAYPTLQAETPNQILVPHLIFGVEK